MTHREDTCIAADQLLKLLRDQLGELESEEIKAHLDRCDACRLQLENSAADRESWREASELLTEDPWRCSHQSRLEVTSWTSSRQIQQVLEILQPTDDPRMLGRLGTYEVSGVIGSGGMGVVLKAFDPSLDRTVAIKVLAAHLACSGAARQRFEREAKAAAAVIHPNVIAIHAVASHAPLPYLVMPYLRGATLQKRIESEGALPLVDVLRIGVQIAAGLAAAHRQGLVHRDIKPANVLLEDGVERVTITDFGLARATDDASLTRTGVIAGTPQYMSPEQARGELVDHRTDLFSLGSVLYTLCTGRPPFRADSTFGVLRRISDNEPHPIQASHPEVPGWLCGLIDKLMAKLPADRFATAQEVAELLESALAHVQQPAVVSLPANLGELSRQLRPQKPRANDRQQRGRRNRWVGLTIVAGLALALLAAVIIILRDQQRGTLTIESDLDDIPITILQNDEVVEKLTVTRTGKSVRVAAGQYLVVLDGEHDGIDVGGGTVTLKRGGRQTVRIVKSADQRVSKQSGRVGVEILESEVLVLRGKKSDVKQVVESFQAERTERFRGSVMEFTPRTGSDPMNRRDGPKVRVFVEESHISSIRVDQTAKIMVDALPGRSFPGRVSEVNDVPQTAISQTGAVTQMYLVIVAFTDWPEILKAGLTATVSFESTTAEESAARHADPVALVMLMHPAELVGGNSVQQSAASVALGQLQSSDYCGILKYARGTPVWLWGDDQGVIEIGEHRAKLLQAIAGSQTGDFPAFDPALRMAHLALSQVQATRRHMIVLTDGDPSLVDPSILEDFRKSGIAISVIHIELHGPRYEAVPKRIANETGGRYYHVLDAQPSVVERLFLREVTLLTPDRQQNATDESRTARPEP